MQKLLVVGDVTGRCEVGHFEEVEQLLSDGWRVKDMQAVSTEEYTCCYVLLEKSCWKKKDK